MLAVVILAAGKGKRMKNPEKAKVMFELKGKPMIEYVVDLALKINSDRIIVIAGHQKKSVIEFVAGKFIDYKNKIYFAHQDQQLGTGHAVMQTEKQLSDFNGMVMILSGDVPLLSEKTLKKFLEYHISGQFDATLISAIMDNPDGYGRIIRNSSGDFIDIVEHKDATEEQKTCKEINSGIYIIKSEYLFDALKTLKADNAQQEYYLTDVFLHFKNKGLKIGAIPADNNIEIEGVNTIEQLENLAKHIH